MLHGTAHSRGIRRGALEHALRLEYLTVGWNLAEGIIAVGAALGAGSVVLLGFGIDSFVECASAGILIWRLRAERPEQCSDDIARLDRRAHRMVGGSLFLLAAYIDADAAWSLWQREVASQSIVGIVLTSVSLGVMWWLARLKRRAAISIGSRALEADAFQTTACWWLSLITLAGLGLNALVGWWWADPVAALGMTYFLVEEGRQAWRGEECCR